MHLIESLESRRLLSASGMGLPHHPAPAHGLHGHGPHGPPPAAVVHGVNLQVKGTKGNDVITVTVDSADASKLDVTVNGTLTVVSSARLRHIQVKADKGDDQVTVDSAVKINAQLMGGLGNDTLCGGGGKNLLAGGPGTNTLNGGTGVNTFVTANTTVTSGPDTITNFDPVKGDVLKTDADGAKAPPA
jgi:Ca2+-binding RTX toxin-like protein